MAKPKTRLLLCRIYMGPSGSSSCLLLVSLGGETCQWGSSRAKLSTSPRTQWPADLFAPMPPCTCRFLTGEQKETKMRKKESTLPSTHGLTFLGSASLLLSRVMVV